MKIEHMEAIERAKRHGVMPSVLAHELLVRDLVDAAMFEWQNIAAPYSKLNEGQRQEVTDRVTEKVTTAVYTAVGIISSRSVDTIPLTVADAKFKAKSITVTATIDAQDPNRHGLIDVAGKLCLLVLAPNDYAEGLDSLTVERDQRDLPLHVSNLTGGLFGGGTGPDEPDGVKHPLGTEEELNALVNAGKSGGVDDDQIGSKDPLYNEAVEQLIAYGRLGAAAIAGALSISNERASQMLNAMVESGAAVAIDGGNVFEIKGGAEAEGNAEDQNFGLVDTETKEFGDFSYDDAKQLIVLKAGTKAFKAHWVQSRLAIDSDKVASLLLRLLDDKVVAVEAEGESALEHSYKVIATLEDVV
ncbi:DNA translocase FtsK [Pseudomonas sp. 43A]|uniref:DNA translocase FtsK n=1 Tax=unclassified Pseudomonas TaxID=196821 RepID=UPI0015875221|nr:MULTISPECIES: DNA translocase FtsK [unclassified Pseudomonas]QKV66502.1 DNA translocase FtsK [Pseudomonas sp. 43A]QMW11045.1 DNA translocase FtsK [Pseudomonas sp. 29A]